MLGPAGPSGSVMELRFFRGLGALYSFFLNASRSLSLWCLYGFEMKGRSLVGLRGRGMRSVSGWGPSDGLGPTLLAPL